MKIELKKLIFYLALAAICYISVIGAAVYFFYELNWLGISLTLILSAFGFWQFWRLFAEPKKAHLDTDDIAENFIVRKNKLSRKKLISIVAWFAPYVVFFVLCSLFLFASRTDAALTSPWQNISPFFFISYLLATAYLLYLIINNTRLTLWLITAHYFLSFSILWIVFKIGYGYDPFIHQATVRLIDNQGFVLPKTAYYLGQYSLVLLAHKLFFLPVAWADKLLVPLFAALTIPVTIHFFLKKYFTNAFSLLPILLLLIIPFSIFTLTVPQNLAYLFLLLAIFFALFARSKPEIILSFLLAFAALAAHPIAGIPALLFAFLMLAQRAPTDRICFARKNKNGGGETCLDRPRAGVLRIKTLQIGAKKRLHFSARAIGDFFFGKKFFAAIIFALTALVLPWLFYLSGINSPASAAAGNDAGLSPAGIVFPRQENILLNTVYFFINNEWLILTVLCLLAAFIIYRWSEKIPRFFFLAGMGLSLLLAFLITKRLNFDFLISYERNDYAGRILIDAFIFIIPVLAIAAGEFAKLILAAKPLVKYSWLILLAILIAISLYGSYPRIDNYFNSHSFSFGTSDLSAVKWIAQDSSSTPYVVLADQQVSVAALWTFGFGHYFNSPLLSKEGSGGGSDIYFYPIPTGGPLYQMYLQMVYQKPNRATALQAADLTGASTVYFVINKYWTSFDKIVEQAKIDSDSFQNIDNGQLYIFKYKK